MDTDTVTKERVKDLEKTKEYKDLGFRKIEVAEITSKLNKTLSTYQVFFHKLQNFHWNVIGSDFFDVHEITEQMYTKALQDIDNIAERIRVFGATPVYRMSDYLTQSILEETSHEKSAEFIFHEITEDITKVLETMLDTYEYASANGDVGTIHMTQAIIHDLEMYHWQLTSWLKSRGSKK